MAIYSDIDPRLDPLTDDGKHPNENKIPLYSPLGHMSYDQVDAWMKDHPDYITTVVDNSIDTRKIVDHAVTEDKIANDSVGSDALKSTGVTPGSYGNPVDQYPAFGGTFKSTLIDIDSDGRIVDAEDKTVKIPDTLMSATTKGIAKVGAGLTMNGEALELDGSGDIATAVTSWLDAHPEATTTVQDGSITNNKLADDAITDAKMSDDSIKTAFNGSLMSLIQSIDSDEFVSNSAYEINEHGIIFKNSVPGGYPYLHIPNSCMLLKGSTAENGMWPIIFKGSNGNVVINSLSRSIIYVSNDTSTVEGLSYINYDRTNFQGKDTFYIKDDDSIICKTDNKTFVFLASTVNTVLNTAGISDVVEPCLGYSCNNNTIDHTTYCELFFETPDMDKSIENALLIDSVQNLYKDEYMSNSGYVVNKNGILFISQVSGSYPRMYTPNACMLLKGTTLQNGMWPVLFKGTNGDVVVNSNSRMLIYISYDMITITWLTVSGYDSSDFVGMDTFFINDGSSITFKADGVSSFNLSEDDINLVLSNASISDVVEPCLGYSCNNNAIDHTTYCELFFRTPVSPDDFNLWIDSTGDFLGDSLTAQGYYTGAFESLYGITVYNYGVSGTTISNINPTNMFKDRIASMSTDCDFVFVLGGTNDWGLGVPLGQKSQLVTDDYSTFYSAIYNTFAALRDKFKTTPIFCATIPQRNWQGGGQSSGIFSNANGNSIMEFNDAIKYVANIFGIIVIDSFECGITTLNLNTYTSDNLHFNLAGGTRFTTFAMDNMKQITPW